MRAHRNPIRDRQDIPGTSDFDSKASSIPSLPQTVRCRKCYGGFLTPCKSALAGPKFPTDQLCVSEGVYWSKLLPFIKCFIGIYLNDNMYIEQRKPVAIPCRISTGCWRNTSVSALMRQTQRSIDCPTAGRITLVSGWVRWMVSAIQVRAASSPCTRMIFCGRRCPASPTRSLRLLCPLKRNLSI